MNSENTKTSDPHRLLLNLLDKMNLNRSGKYVAYPTLAFTIHEKISKSHTKVINLKYQLRHGMKTLNYLMDQIFKIFFNMT